MNLEPRHPLQRYWDLAAAAVQAEALNVALTLDLFEALCAPRTAHELAGLLGLDAGNTGHLLDLLWSMDLLERDPRRAPERAVYLIAPVARSYLLRASPAWCGDAWRYRQGRLQQAAGMLERQVRQGALTDSAPSPERGAAQWAQAARKQLAQEQHAATVPAALAALARVPESAAATRLLDLGGGPGWVAIALARQHERLHGAVFDFPEAAAVAEENIAAAGLVRRLCVVGGDLASDDIGGDYDLVWCSSVLHFVPDMDATLRKVRAAMRPGGVLVCAHAQVAADAQAAARVLPYYLPIMLQGRRVPRQGEMAGAMRAAGFARIEGFESSLFPMAPLRVVVGRRSP